MNQNTNVNVVPSYGQRGDLHFSQYDVGRTATINLYAVNEAYTIPLGATIKIQATKPSGLGFDVACTFSGSVVTVVSTETMTAEAGRFPCELHIIDNSDVIGTANFMFCVEASPHPDGVIDGDAEEVVNEIKALVLQSEGWALGTQDGVPVDSSSVYYHNNAKWLSDNAVLSDEVKMALLNCFEKVAWIDANGQSYYNTLATALNRGAELISISAVYTQSGTVYDTDSLDSLKPDLVVTGTYDGGETATVLTYTLSGSLTVGTSTITVSYEGKTATFNVTVKEGFYYTPSNGLLKNQSYITYSETTNVSESPFTESIVDDYLKLTAENLGSSNWGNAIYDLQWANVSNYGRLKIEFRLIDLGSMQTTNTSTKGYFWAQMNHSSNGSFVGFARIGSATSDAKIKYSTTSQTTNGITVALNTWHTVEFVIENGKQTVVLDNTNVITDANLSTLSSVATGVNRISVATGNTNPVEVHIKNIEFEVRS